MKIMLITLLSSILLFSGCSNRASTAEVVVSVDIPMMVYHHLVSSEQEAINAAIITPEKFKADLVYFKEAGYTTIFFRDLVKYKEKGGCLPVKPLVITFDDGFKQL